jgi:hypothetical protein
LIWCALSDERTGLSFTLAAGPRQRSHFRVRVPYDSWPYFTVSYLRIPFWSPPTTRRVTVDVFDTASTRVSSVLLNTSYNYYARTTRKAPSSIVQNACLLVRYLAINVLLLLSACVAGMCLPTRCLAMGIMSHYIMIKSIYISIMFILFAALIDCSVLFKCK